MKTQYKGFVALLFALLELSLLPVMLEIGGKSVGTITLLFYAFLVGSVVSLVASYNSDRLNGFISILRSGRMLILLAVVGLFNDLISQLLLGIGTLGTNPVVAATVFRSWVIIAAFLIPFTLRQKVTRIQILATLIGFSGVYLLATNGSFLGINLSELPYILILLGSAIATVYPNIIMKQYNVDIFGATALFNICSVIAIFFLASATGTPLLVGFNPGLIFTALFLGIATYGIGTTMYYYALKIFGPLFVGNSILIVPFATIVLSSLILGTPIQSYYIIAALLLSAGVVMQQKFASAPEHISHKGALSKLWVFDVTSAFAHNRNREIHTYISGKKSALAIMLKGNVVIDRRSGEIFIKNGCVVFTNRKPLAGIKNSEIDFVNDLMKCSKKDTIIIGIGAQDMLDSSFDEFMKLKGNSVQVQNINKI